MIVIDFDKNKGNVSVAIEISTFLPWAYVYVEENTPFTYKKNSNEKEPFPHRYALGYPNQMNFDINSFDINIFNSKSEDYTVRFTWYQEQNDGGKPNILHIWEKNGKTDDSTSTIVFLKGSVFFVAN